MIRLELRKTFGATAIELSLELPAGELAALYGKSGAGKTTLLRMIAGLTKPDEGFIEVDGDLWFDSRRGIDLPPQKRRAGFVFQDYALFPNMTVRENLAFAAGKGEKKHLADLAELAELQPYLERRPHQLSGGQKQRVALARALAARPALLLLDEPLAALDLEMRLALQDGLLALHRRSGATTLLVSHDISEVFKMAASVVVLEAGRVARHGAPMQVFGDQGLSGKFRFTGEVVAVEKQDIVYVVAVVVGNSILRVMATADEVKDLRPGDRVLLLSKAFNPLIMKL